MYGLSGALLASAAFALLWRFIRRLDGRSLSPAGIYVVRWWLLVILYCLNPLGYPRLSWQAWLAVISAVGCFAGGYVLIRATTPQNARAAWEESAGSIDERIPPRLWKAMLAVFTLGAGLYLAYAFQVALRYGPQAAVLGPHQLRDAISDGHVPLGFHYLYFFELIPALAVLLARRYRPTPGQLRMLVVLGCFSAVALLGTTARTNTFKAIVWAGVVYLYTQRPRRVNRRIALLFGGGVVTIMFLFTAIGNNLGKSYENSAFGGGRVPVPEWFRPLTLPYHYNAAELPTLDALIHDPDRTLAFGAYTFNPIVSVLAAVVPDMSAPSHIGEFYSNPYPFNVATQLDVFIRDFGLVGVPVGSFLLGLCAGHLTFRFLRGRRDPMNLLLVTWLAMVLNSSTGAAAFAKVSYLLQLLVILLIRRYLRGRRNVAVPSRLLPVSSPVRA